MANSEKRKLLLDDKQEEEGYDNDDGDEMEHWRRMYLCLNKTGTKSDEGGFQMNKKETKTHLSPLVILALPAAIATLVV